MKHPSVSRSTHTVEMRQIEQVNDTLAQRPAARAVTAEQVGLDHAVLMTGLNPGGTLPANAVLLRVDGDGDPEFPYLHADFGDAPGQPTRWRVDVHTDAMRQLAHLLGLRQVWGVGSPSARPPSGTGA